MLHFCNKIGYNFATTQRYVIKNLSYLVEAPPTRPVSGFNIFCKKQSSGKKGINATQTMKKTAESWKKMSQEQKIKYQHLADAQNVNYENAKQAYISNYVIPFKKISAYNLYLSHLFKHKIVTYQKNGSITGTGKAVGEKIKKATKQELAPFQKQAQNITKQRQIQADKHKFPARIYHSQRSFSLANKELSKEKKQIAYQAYLTQWEIDVIDWLQSNKINLSISNFMRMYNKELKKRTEKASLSRQVSNAKRVVANAKGTNTKVAAKRTTLTKKASSKK